MSLQRPVPRDGVLIGNRPDAIAQIGPSATEGNGGKTAAAESSAAPPTAAMQTRAAILTGPVLPTLLRQALPTMTVWLAQTAVNVAEAYYVGFLGTDALAGVALVFPVFMLMTMMSGGGTRQRRRFRGGARYRRRRQTRRGCPCSACRGSCRNRGRAVYDRHHLGRTAAVQNPRRPRQVAGCGAGIFQLSVCRRDPGVDREPACRGASRLGQRQGPGDGDAGRRDRADPVLADPDFRARPDAGIRKSPAPVLRSQSITVWRRWCCFAT